MLEGEVFVGRSGTPNELARTLEDKSKETEAPIKSFFKYTLNPKVI